MDRMANSPHHQDLANKRLETDADRLCRHLARPNVQAVEDEFDPKRVCLVSRSQGIARVDGSVARDAAEFLVRHDLAEWTTGDVGKRRLVATEAGRARALRLAAPAQLDPFLVQHASLAVETVVAGDDRRTVLRNEAESPLAWLRSRRGRQGSALIDEPEFAAGERLRADLDRACIMPRVTANWTAAVATGKRDASGPALATEAMVAARQRVRRALDAVGPDFAGLLVDVCGFLKGLSQIEHERQWPARSAKVVLHLALRRLAAHYGLSNEVRGPSAARRIESWAAADARPTIS
jgi:hypothetical protein